MPIIMTNTSGSKELYIGTAERMFRRAEKFMEHVQPLFGPLQRAEIRLWHGLTLVKKREFLCLLPEPIHANHG